MALANWYRVLFAGRAIYQSSTEVIGHLLKLLSKGDTINLSNSGTSDLEVFPSTRNDTSVDSNLFSHTDKTRWSRGSLVVKVSDRVRLCHEFKLSTTKDPPCR
ncbi:hypothetical protein TNCV_4133211 [Trichonephila clavipes]|uniref:Uncharacterized protein n=1 Tax=Trichonephila clavipes TaxID=2585209 RepID=A0A8X6S6I6_TRICX|nr:hypothetical protein TNCV_4133211 [Trichonephila clavipes]